MRISDWSSDVCSSDLVHHAGHESRLNRKTLISTSRADYARDELVAELGASFIGAIVGFKVEEREDHAAYIEHWLTALRNDKRAIFEAAREAQNAADYLLAMMTDQARSEEHTSELQSLMRISYAVFCLNKKNKKKH